MGFFSFFRNKHRQSDLDAVRLTRATGTKRSRQIWRQYKKNKGAVLGLFVLCAFVVIAIASGFIWNYDTDIVGMNISERLLKPCAEHLFGTDHMGRDVLTRVFYGTRYSLLIGFGSTLISTFFGILFGAIAGYYGGKIENVTMRIVELLLMIPNMLLTIVIVSAFGINLGNLILAQGLATIPHFTRNARASIMTVRDNEYIEAARAMGVSDFKIIVKHVLPNALSPILVQVTTRIGGCIVGAAGFSFLGLGVPIPTPEWGAMLADARTHMRANPHLVIFPGLAILILVLAINQIGDGLRDALDPKLKR
ncbi:MAG: ABC transporter permease [Clostridia bacterium]|nr:ABC transporter permease [Clostridia bacterium]MBQ2731363.1 ABC transporter permease [Clostridia bacterium]